MTKYEHRYYNPDDEQPVEGDFPWLPLGAAVAAGLGVTLLASYAFGAKRPTTGGSAAYNPAFSGQPTAAQCAAARNASPLFTGAVAQSGTPRCACVSGYASPGGTRPCVATGGSGGGTAPVAPPQVPAAPRMPVEPPPAESAGYDPAFSGRPTAAQCQAAQRANSKFTGLVSSDGSRCACITNFASSGGTQPCACPPNTGEYGTGGDRRCCPSGQFANSTNTGCTLDRGAACSLLQTQSNGVCIDLPNDFPGQRLPTGAFSTTRPVPISSTQANWQRPDLVIPANTAFTIIKQVGNSSLVEVQTASGLRGYLRYAVNISLYAPSAGFDEDALDMYLR